MIQSVGKNDEEHTTSDSTENLIAPSTDFEKLQVSQGGKAMSSVYSGSDEPQAKRSSSSSRRSSKGGSPDSRRKSSSPFPKFHRRSSSHAAKEKRDKDHHLAAWLHDGNVIYKSVGLGLMDLAVGTKMVEFAKEKGLGTHIEGF